MGKIVEQAMFVGKDGSMGLEKGNRYDVEVKILFGRIFVSDIPYETMSAVQKNWDFRKPFANKNNGGENK